MVMTPAPVPPSPQTERALAAKGFRPFFLVAAIFASVIIPISILTIRGVVPSVGYLSRTTWHAHEMVFGFAVAVIGGFLLTSVGNWTKRETVVGAPLLGLASLWVLGRLAMAFAAFLPRAVPAVIDLAFLPVLIFALARPLIATRNRRNFVMLAVLGALAAANVVVHLDGLGVVSPGTGRRAALIAIDVVILLILIISGRVVPMFTRNTTGVASIRSSPILDGLAIAAMVGFTALDALRPASWVVGGAAGVAGVLALARTAHWGTRHTARYPLLWILHAGYAWIVLGLLLRAVAALDAAIPESFATHALTVGAIGSLTLGMMARVALGHTGRQIVASRPIAAAFVALTAAAFVRAIVPLIAPQAYAVELYVAAGLWTAAFILFLVVHVPTLSSPRADGKSG